MFLQGRADLMREWEKKYPGLKKDIVKGKYAAIFPESIAKPLAAPAQPKPTRMGDLALRSPIDKLPPIGAAMRKIPLGALATRALGPVGYALTAASFASPAWELLSKSVGPAGLWSRYAKNIEAARVSAPMPRSPRPEIAPIRVTAKRMISPVVVTAKRITRPTGVIVTSGSVVVPWWQKAAQALLPIWQASLKAERDARGSRINITNSPFALPPAEPDPGELPIPSPLTPLDPGGASCECPPKQPKRERKPRTECRSGRFIERFSGLQKYETRKVKCRPSRKKQS